MTEPTSSLIEQVKNYINITWSDSDTDKKIQNLVEDAIPAMNHKLGVRSVNYDEAGQERRLFLNYCLYLYNGVANEFDDAYRDEINQIREKYIVLEDAAEEEET